LRYIQRAAASFAYLVFQLLRFTINIVANAVVGSYPAFSPLPGLDTSSLGGIFSVALAVAQQFLVKHLPVRKQNALCCPDFPR